MYILLIVNCVYIDKCVHVIVTAYLVLVGKVTPCETDYGNLLIRQTLLTSELSGSLLVLVYF